MLTYADDCIHKETYRKLKPSGADILVALKHTDVVIVLKGIGSRTSVSRLQNLLEQRTKINVAQQRLFAGGEEMLSEKSLINYFPMETFLGETPKCLIELRSYSTLLISTLQCPGPMLTEIEVRPGHVEPVINVKRRIRDKLRVEVENQHLYLHPNEMTTFTRRQPLSNERLLASYLSCSSPKPIFLELVSIKEKSPNHSIFVRIPRQVLSLKIEKHNVLKYSNQLKTSSHIPRDELPKSANEMSPCFPPPPPQTPETSHLNVTSPPLSPETENEGVFENENHKRWWHTVRLSLDGILKRDPKVCDILNLIINEIEQQPSILFKGSEMATEELHDLINKSSLGYFDEKYMFFDKTLKPDSFISEDNQMRINEMLLHLQLPNHEHRPFLTNIGNPLVKPAHHLPPLIIHTDDHVRYTMSPNPIKLQWKIDSDSPLDRGANPAILFETSAFSYAYKYGSWDIPEHRKIFVEIMLEGTCSVGDTTIKNILLNDSDDNMGGQIDYDVDKLTENRNARLENIDVKRMIYYVQDEIKLTILGPENIKDLKINNLTPFQSPEVMKWEAGQREVFQQNAKLRIGEIGSKVIPWHPPLRVKPPEKNVIKNSNVAPENILPSWADRRNLSKVKSGTWSVSREKISNVQVPGSDSQQAFSTTCKRATTLDGRPNVSVTYKRAVDHRNDIFIPQSKEVEACRSAFDFRVQFQFVVNTPIDEDSQNQIPESTDFFIQASQKLTKIIHERHVPDVKTQYVTPQGKMRARLAVKLPTVKWLQSKSFTGEQTLDLNR